MAETEKLIKNMTWLELEENVRMHFKKDREDLTKDDFGFARRPAIEEMVSFLLYRDQKISHYIAEICHRQADAEDKARPT